MEQERGSQMLIEERRQYIVALAQQHGRVLVEELSQSLGISRITIRSCRGCTSAFGEWVYGSVADHASLAVIYSYGGFTGETTYVRSDDAAATPIHITREGSVPANAVEAFFKNPFANLQAARSAPLKIERARIGQIPSARHGSLVALALFSFIAFFAVGPGVCVWLALSELMPTRIRSVGMSIAVINQVVSTTLAVVFLPVASKYGYSTMFFVFAGFTVVYLVTATFFLPETKGKTLEEIELHFEAPAAGREVI
jgi:MFS transporter, SP family, solute carrier family 2 (myo-inositol transporter), member 13